MSIHNVWRTIGLAALIGLCVSFHGSAQEPEKTPPKGPGKFAEKLPIKAAGEKVAAVKERLEQMHAKMRAMKENNAPREAIEELSAIIEKTEQQLKHLASEHVEPKKKLPGGPAAKFEDMKRRIHHVRVASEHLREAGLGDLAEKLVGQANEMERDLHAALEAHQGRHEPEHHPELHKLRAENERLHAELNELRALVKRKLEK